MNMTKLLKVCASVAAAVACFSAYAGSNGVTASISSAKAALGASDDVVVSVTLTNTSATPQHVLKWYTPFFEMKEPLFDVYRDGKKVTYLGAHYKRMMPTAKDYVMLAPGKSYTQKVELSALYDMSVTGNYTLRYRTESMSLFNGGEASRAGGEMGTIQSDRIALFINGRDMRSTEVVQTGEAGLSYSACSSSQQTAIATSVSSAKTYANNSVSYLTAGTKGSRYTTWFGTYSSTRYATAKSHFTAIKSAFDTKNVVVDCTCTDSGTFAYVYPSQPYKIYVCGAYWRAANTGTDSRAGTMIHEMSHFNAVAATDDHAYGQSAAKSLAISSPTKALDNADSHEYFAENTPALN